MKQTNSKMEKMEKQESDGYKLYSDRTQIEQDNRGFDPNLKRIFLPPLEGPFRFL